MSSDIKNTVKKKQIDTSYTQNRELSWLRFNQRVLEEASDETVPLLERLKFIAIFTSNLDEFFMVRVGSLFDVSVMTPDAIDNKTGQTPIQQLEAIFEAVRPLVSLKDIIYSSVSDALREKEIYDLSFSELTKEELKFIQQYYHDFILPVLSPQIIDPRHPFPHLANKKLYVASILRTKKERDLLGLVPVPDAVPSVVHMPHAPMRFIRTENIINAYMQSIFEIYHVESSCIVCVTRNADISFDEEKFDDEDDDYRRHMARLLKKRTRLAPVRLEIQGEYNEAVTQFLCHRLNIHKNQVFSGSSPLNMQYTFDIKDNLDAPLKSQLIQAGFQPRYPECLDRSKSIARQIQKKDILLFYPFEQMDPFLQLLKESASDPDVISIKITIYRLASSSVVAQHLCTAAENGKDVTVLMELRARFDEENNIRWAERLEQAGCRIIYGMDGYKCHSKICLITRRDKNRIRYITQVGTGNYNEKTAVLYTDLCLMTANTQIGEDATAFFQNMLIANLNGSYHKLLVAPTTLKPNILHLIEEEMQKGAEGQIIIKANSLTERSVIDKLREASCAGVNIQLIIRGICCLRPGIPGKTENISVVSIVGRFLEHSRIYCFGRDTDTKIYISSADLMTRNISRRVEIACPILDSDIQRQLQRILDILLHDNVKARVLQADGTYRKKQILDHDEIIDSQKWFLHHSLQHAAAAVFPESTEPHGHLLNKLIRRFKK